MLFFLYGNGLFRIDISCCGLVYNFLFEWVLVFGLYVGLEYDRVFCFKILEVFFEEFNVCFFLGKFVVVFCFLGCGIKLWYFFFC